MKNNKAFRTFSFCIPGDPIPMPHPVTCENKMWNETKSKQSHFKINILNQFEDQVKEGYPKNKFGDPEPLKGSIELTLHFFLAPKPLYKLDKLNHKPHDDPPRLVELERFVQHMMAHLIFTRASKITKVIASKVFDSTPRTIIKMRVLDE